MKHDGLCPLADECACYWLKDRECEGCGCECDLIAKVVDRERPNAERVALNNAIDVIYEYIDETSQHAGPPGNDVCWVGEGDRCDIIAALRVLVGRMVRLRNEVE